MQEPDLVEVYCKTEIGDEAVKGCLEVVILYGFDHLCMYFFNQIMEGVCLAMSIKKGV